MAQMKLDGAGPSHDMGPKAIALFALPYKVGPIELSTFMGTEMLSDMVFF